MTAVSCEMLSSTVNAVFRPGKPYRKVLHTNHCIPIANNHLPEDKLWRRPPCYLDVYSVHFCLFVVVQTTLGSWTRRLDNNRVYWIQNIMYRLPLLSGISKWMQKIDGHVCSHNTAWIPFTQQQLMKLTRVKTYIQSSEEIVPTCARRLGCIVIGRYLNIWMDKTAKL